MSPPLPLSPRPAPEPSADPVALQVGDLAKRSGKTVRALHLYEELGLLRPLGRSKGRFRLYGEDALIRIRWIAKLQDLGLSLHEIRAMAQEAESVDVAPQVAERMRVIYEQKLEDTREQLAKLKELEAELQTALVYLQECSALCDSATTGAPARSLHECRSCELRDASKPSGGCPSDVHSRGEIPDLVRGYQLGGVPAAGPATEGVPAASPSKTFLPIRSTSSTRTERDDEMTR